MKLTWKQEEVYKVRLSEFLTDKQLHPGYFHIVEDRDADVIVVYLDLEETEL